MIYYKIFFKIIYKNIFLNFYIYIIDILWFFIKQNKKKKFNKNTKSNLKIFKKNNWFSQMSECLIYHYLKDMFNILL